MTYTLRFTNREIQLNADLNDFHMAYIWFGNLSLQYCSFKTEKESTDQIFKAEYYGQNSVTFAAFGERRLKTSLPTKLWI